MRKVFFSDKFPCVSLAISTTSFPLLVLSVGFSFTHALKQISTELDFVVVEATRSSYGI